jgi:hypothetical protein
MEKMFLKLISSAAVTIALSGVSYAESFKVAVLPNEIFQKGVEKNITIDSINKHKVDFVIFGGDSKDGKSKCSDEIILDGVKNYFNKLNAPTLYSLGDNEWTDCHRTSNGSYDPLERLQKLRKTFFSKSTTQGKEPLKVEREGKLGEKFSENSRLIHDNVMFIALHVVGSNNNMVATDKQCHKKSKRTAEDCAKATDEYKERNAANIKWLKESFDIARKEKLAGVVIVAHADIYFPYELSDHGYQEKFLPSLNDKNGFTDFFHTLDEETHNYPGQVVLLMGDSHYYKVDKAMFDKDGSLTNNFTRVETFGSKETSWVEIDVDPSSKNVFAFKPVTLPSLKKQH